MDYEILGQQPPIAGFDLAEKQDDPKNAKELKVTWKYFDSGYRTKFQIIYEVHNESKSDTPLEMHFNGRISGVGGFTNATREAQKRSWIYFISAALIICAGSWLLKFTKQLKEQGWTVFVSISIVYLGMVVVAFLLLRESQFQNEYLLNFIRAK